MGGFIFGVVTMGTVTRVWRRWWWMVTTLAEISALTYSAMLVGIIGNLVRAYEPCECVTERRSLVGNKV